MTIRQDKYEVGDIVYLDMEFYRRQFPVDSWPEFADTPEGPYKVVHIQECDQPRYVKHTQWLEVDPPVGKHPFPQFSGAYFKPVR